MPYHDAGPGEWPTDTFEPDDDVERCPRCRQLVDAVEFELTGQPLCCTCAQSADEPELHRDPRCIGCGKVLPDTCADCIDAERALGIRGDDR